MPIRMNTYNDPNIGALFGQTATIVAPPTAQTLAGYGQAGLDFQRKAAIGDLLANPNQPNFDRKNMVLGNYGGTSSLYAQDQNNATARANNENSVKGSVIANLYGQLAPGAVRPDVPTNIASTIGLPQLPAVAGLPSADTAKAAAFNAMTPAQQTEVTMQGVTPVPVRNSDGATSLENPQQAVVAGATPAVVPGSAQQAFQNADATNQATDYKSILDSGRQAQSRIGVLDVLDQASKGAGYQGVGGTSAMAVRQALSAFGIDTAKESDAEVLQSGGSQLALQMRNPANGGGMPGSMSDGDRQFLSSMVAGLDHTPQGNQKLIAIARAIAQRDVQTAAAATDYVNKHGVLDGNFTVQQAHYNDTHPLLPGMPANPKDASDFAVLPPGMQYVDPGDGLVHVKQ